eukprot:scaffold13809_cov69-Skeletonema_menzelii.AAC.4
MAPQVWHSTHQTYMQEMFSTFAHPDKEGGWDPCANTNQVKKYFAAVIDDEKTPFGVIPSDRSSKLDEKKFVSNFKKQSRNYLSTNGNPKPKNQVSAPAIARMAKRIAENKNGKVVDVDSDSSEEEDEEEALSAEQETANDDGNVTYPYVQYDYVVMREDSGSSDEKIYLTVAVPAGWSPSVQDTDTKILELSDDGGRITLTFTASGYVADDRLVGEVLYSSVLNYSYLPNEHSGVLHPAVLALRNSVSVSGQQTQGQNHTMEIKLLKKCSRISSVEGYSSNKKAPAFFSYVRDEIQEEVVIMNVLHIELDVENEERRRRVSRQDFERLQNSNRDFSQSPKSWGRSNSTHRGAGYGRNGSSFWQGGGERNDGSGLKSRKAGKSLSPPRQPLHLGRRGRSLSPYNQNQGSEPFSNPTEEQRRREDPPSADSHSFSMETLSASLGEIEVGPSNNKSRNKVGLEERVSKMERQLQRMQRLMQNSSSIGERITFLERKTYSMDNFLSQRITDADNRLFDFNDGLNVSITQLKDSIRGLRDKVYEQKALNQKLQEM